MKPQPGPKGWGYCEGKPWQSSEKLPEGTLHNPLHRQAGFVITIELILIITILVIGSFAGLVAIRDALIKRHFSKQSEEVTVYDATGTRLGKAIGFDEHEAPRLFYIDRTVPPLSPDPNHRNYRALISVRDDRFTSREPVYYEGENCTGTPCIKSPSDELSDSRGLSGDIHTGVTGYLYALQNINGPTYAIGSSPDGIQGYLYRSTANACAVPAQTLQSRFLSQKVITGSPCENYEAPTDSPPDTSCVLDDPVVGCSCPAGYTDQGNILSLYLPQAQLLANTLLAPIPGVDAPTLGTVCCEDGSTLEEDSSLTETLVFIALDQYSQELPDNQRRAVRDVIRPYAGELRCITTFEFREAIEVPDPNNETANALAGFTAPFLVDLPAGGVSADSWQTTAPDGEGVTP